MDDPRIRDFLAADYQRVLATVTLIVQDQAIAEDAVQEAVARLWEQLDRGSDIYSPTGWVLRVAINFARSARRRRAAERRAAARMSNPREAADLPLEALAVERALTALTRREREVSILRYYLEFSVREIAETLDIAEGTVKALLFRSRRTLAEQLNHPQEEITRHAGS